MESNYFLKIEPKKLSFVIDESLIWQINIEDIAIIAYTNSESGGEPINTVAIVNHNEKVNFFWLYDLKNYEEVISFLSENFNFKINDYPLFADKMSVFYPKVLYGFQLYSNSSLSLLIKFFSPSRGKLSRIMKDYLKK